MYTKICDTLNIELPVFGFSHCRDVVASVSRSGGCGVLGAATMSPDELHTELSWIDAEVKGRPYGVDLIIPASFEGKDNPFELTPDMVPPAVRTLVENILRAHDIDPEGLRPAPIATPESLSLENVQELIEVALSDGASIVASALGAPPDVLIEMASHANVPVAALVGSSKHALTQLEKGVSVLVAQGYEAGGHTGDIGTFVLTPDIIATVENVGSDVPVLTAGGVMSGRHIAAALALGASGVWCGSLWLTSHEAETTPHLKQKLLDARTSDTVRSRYRTGKPSRQLRSTWHDAWEQPGSPPALPMPLMQYASEPALRRAEALADAGHEGGRRLNTFWSGQGIGLVHASKSVKKIMGELVEEYIDAVSALTETIDETGA